MITSVQVIIYLAETRPIYSLNWCLIALCNNNLCNTLDRNEHYNYMVHNFSQPERRRQMPVRCRVRKLLDKYS